MSARPVRHAAFAMLLLCGLSGCGKDHEGDDEIRKPPPLPAKTEPGKPPATSPAKADPPKAEGGKPEAPAVEAKVAVPLKKTVDITVDYTGQTVGSETVEIRARVEGYLQSIHFNEGNFVKKGDLLYEIDKEKMNEVVEQAEGELNVQKANEEKAAADVARNKPLVEKNAISREEYETSVSALKAAHAKVEASAAAVARAKIQLGYATVRAPVAGLVGKTEVDVGNLVGRGESTLLTTISQVDPIYAEVRISETDMLEYQRANAAGTRKAGELPLALFFSDGTRHPQPGKIAVIDRNIDTKTGTLLVQVSFPNPDQSVRPGQFARVQAVKEVVKDALLLPQGAIDELQGTQRVYVLDAGDVVRIKPVKTGARLGNLWLVKQGLDAADRVIVEGRQKVRDGSRVAPTVMTINEDGSLSGPGSAGPSGGGN